MWSPKYTHETPKFPMWHEYGGERSEVKGDFRVTPKRKIPPLDSALLPTLFSTTKQALMYFHHQGNRLRAEAAPAQHERDPSTKLRTPFIRGKTPVARRRREEGRQFFAVVARETPFFLPPPLIRYLMKSFRPPAPLSPLSQRRCRNLDHTRYKIRQSLSQSRVFYIPLLIVFTST